MIITLFSVAAGMALAHPTSTVQGKNLEFNVKVGTAGTSSDCEKMTAFVSTIHTRGLAVVPVRRAEGNYCAAIGSSLKPKYRSTIHFDVADVSSRRIHIHLKQFANTSSVEAAKRECNRYRETVENLAALDSERYFISFSAGCLITGASTVDLSTTVQITRK